LLDLGILGGGQLARMMIYRSAHLGLRIGVLDPDPECSASFLTPHCVVGSLKDPTSIRQLAQQSRLMTFDIEHLNIQALLELEREGYLIRPSPRVLQVVQNKFFQKQHLERAGVPQPKFGLGVTTVRPLVIKTQTGGYDGRGVQVLHTEEELIQLSGELYWEEFVETQMELAVVGVATPSGDLFFYPPVEMVFNPDLNICDQVLQPARLNASLTREALEIARTVLKSFLPLGLVGVMAVEMFVSTEGRILVNEVAPRPHNSGHATMEIAQPCQFEAHVRAVMDLPLAPPQIKGAAWMKNLLGIGQGKPVLEGQEILSDPKVRLHLYAKPECRNGRKMGHVSVVAPTPEQALEQSALVANLRVRGQTLP